MAASFSEPPVLAGYTIALTPWVLHNEQLYYGRFVLIDTNSGYNFLVGNNPHATGRLEPDDWDRIAAVYWTGVASDAERSAISYREGLRYIRSDPLRTAGLAVTKLGYLVGLEGREHTWVYSHLYFGARTSTVVWAWGVALLISFPLLMLAAVAGLFRPGLSATAAGRCVVTILLTVAALHTLSFGESRFHLPWVPLLAALAARTVDRAEPKPVTQRWAAPNRVRGDGRVPVGHMGRPAPAAGRSPRHARLGVKYASGTALLIVLSNKF